MFLSVAALLVHSSGCSNFETPHNLVDIQKAGQLQVGTSLTNVRSALGSEGNFGFLTMTERGEQLGLEYRVGSWQAPMFFIFEDSALRSIVPIPKVETVTVLGKNGTPGSVPIPKDPNIVLEEIRRSESFLGLGLIEYAEQKKPNVKPHIPNNLVPLVVAGIVAPPLIVAGIGQELDRPRVLKDRELARRQWGYERIGLGMKQREVELVFGEPRLVQTEGRVRGCVYGDRRRGTEIAVEFYNGHVQSLFGPRFRPFDWTGERRRAVLASCLPANSSSE